MRLYELQDYVSTATLVVPVVKHPYLNCFIQIKQVQHPNCAYKIEKIHADGSCIYVQLSFDDYVRAFFDENLDCCFKWHQIYVAKTIQELLLLDENGYFVAVLEDLNF